MAESGMNFTRRSLLQTGSCAAALASVPAAWHFVTAWTRPKAQLAELTAESFQPYEGQDFVFTRPVAAPATLFSRPVQLKLVRVEVHDRIARIESQNPARYAGKRTRQSFSLHFELRGGEPLADGLHRLVHRDFVGCQLFLSQISKPRPDGTLLYEAVFG